MKFIDEIAEYLPVMKAEKPAVGKIVLKTALITTAVLAFVPTVFKINKGKGFDAYGILSHVKYEKKTNDEGKTEHDVSVTLVDLSRYGVNELNVNKEEQEEPQELIEAEAVVEIEE
ncbi:MAG: hypothetical protein IJY39_04785 [Clostridia bacterium]|nr:hypothetical protein [Clostridia bacterium]